MTSHPQGPCLPDTAFPSPTALSSRKFSLQSAQSYSWHASLSTPPHNHLSFAFKGSNMQQLLHLLRQSQKPQSSTGKTPANRSTANSLSLIDP